MTLTKNKTTTWTALMVQTTYALLLPNTGVLNQWNNEVDTKFVPA